MSYFGDLIFARRILRSHMQYVIEIGSNYGFQYTQGSVKYLG